MWRKEQYMINKRIITLISLILIIANVLLAYKPAIIFQGKITDENGVRITGNYPVIFSIYENETGGGALWTEIHNNIKFENGIFSVELGSEVSFDNLGFDKSYYLGINVNNAGELLPRTKINYNMFSIKSAYSDTAAVAKKLDSDAQTQGSLTVAGDLIVDKSLTVADSLTVKKYLEVADAVMVNKYLEVADTLTVNNNFIIKKDGKVGINNLNPTERLDVTGNVKATQFIGDGSQLTNLRYNSLTGDIISKSEVNVLMNNISIDTSNLKKEMV